MNLLSEEPDAGDFPHRIVETLRFADTDRNGHITSSVFAICCQSGRLGLLSDPSRSAEPPHAQFVLASLQLDYVRELHWPGTVEIGTRIERIGRSSVTLTQALFQAGRCAAIARSVAVLMDANTRRSRPIPAISAEILNAYISVSSLELGVQPRAPAPTPLPAASEQLRDPPR